MKSHVKLFEDFLNEEDPFAGLTGGGEEEKKKEDPIKKMQDEERKKKKRREEAFDQYMDERTAEVIDILKEMPDIDEEYGKVVKNALYSRDRVKIHNAVNELIYAQVKYQKLGDTDKISKISRVKDILDDLDRSFTSSKML